MTDFLPIWSVVHLFLLTYLPSGKCPNLIRLARCGKAFPGFQQILARAPWIDSLMALSCEESSCIFKLHF